MIAGALEGTASGRLLEVPARRGNAELISGHYRLFADMTLGLVYMLTGKWCRCGVTEGETVRIRYFDDDTGAPEALRRLREAISARPRSAPDPGE